MDEYLTPDQESESLFEQPLAISLLDDVPGPVLIVKNNKFSGCNAAAVGLFRFSDRTSIVGKDLPAISAATLPDGSDSAVIGKNLLDRVVPGKNFRFEWVFQKTDGTTFDAKVTARKSASGTGSYILLSVVNNNAESQSIRDIRNLSIEMKKGNLRARLNTEGYHGDLETMMQNINSMLNDILFPFRDMSKVLVQISKGDIHARLTHSYEGEHERIRNAVNGVADSISHLQEEIERLINAAISGDLAERGRPELFVGAYADMISRMNEMLNTILNPIRHGNRVLQKMSKGDLSEKVTIECVGDHAKLKNAINSLHDWLSDLITYITTISQGDMSASIEQASDRDQMYGPLIEMRDNIRSLIKDVNILVQGGIKGDLSIRADPSHHKGDFRGIVEGMNNTLDSVIVPVHEAMQVAEKYAQYNFSCRINQDLTMNGDWIAYKEALDLVGNNVSKVVSTINDQILILNSVVTQEHGSINDVTQGSNVLASIAEKVSINAERGREGINQILQAMEDLAVNVSAVSAKADEVNHLATDTNAISEKGTQLARNAETGMDEITSSTSQVVSIVHEIMEEMKKISQITKVISEIASQTNLLALNAAIEAARAGDAGRGFAVVASEVKSLALESRQSAESITDMIDSLSKKTELASATMDKSAESVQYGGKALKETLDVFNEIIKSIATITIRMDEVARAVEQQAAVVEEITASIDDVNEMVLNTANEAVSAAAASQEAAAASNQLSHQSEETFQVSLRLKQEIEKFTVS